MPPDVDVAELTRVSVRRADASPCKHSLVSDHWPGIGDDGAMTTHPATAEFEGTTFVQASFKGATLRFCDVSNVTMRGVDVDGVDIDSHDLFFGSLIVNGVDVVPLAEAELNRQFRGRELQKAQTPEGLREGWEAVQSAWRTTVAGCCGCSSRSAWTHRPTRRSTRRVPSGSRW